MAVTKLEIITDEAQLSRGQRIRHKDTGIEWDLSERLSVFVAEFDSRLAWLLTSPRGPVVACLPVLTSGSWLLVPDEEAGR